MTQEEVVIAAPPDAVYALVSDPLRMSQWSPECVACRWIGDADRPQVGARFRGTSRNGWHRWSTTSEITAMEPDRRFVWDVTYFGRSVARWEYRVEPHPQGVRLVEAVEDRRGPVLRAVSPSITGSRNRSRRNAATMATTLAAVKAAAERDAT